MRSEKLWNKSMGAVRQPSGSCSMWISQVTELCLSYQQQIQDSGLCRDRLQSVPDINGQNAPDHNRTGFPLKRTEQRVGSESIRFQ